MATINKEKAYAAFREADDAFCSLKPLLSKKRPTTDQIQVATGRYIDGMVDMALGLVEGSNRDYLAGVLDDTRAMQQAKGRLEQLAEDEGLGPRELMREALEADAPLSSTLLLKYASEIEADGEEDRDSTISAAQYRVDAHAKLARKPAPTEDEE